MSNFSKRLRDLREEKNITQKKMAEDLGTTTTTLSRYENDLRDPKSEIVFMLADYLGVTVDYLLGKTDNRRDIHIEYKEMKQRFDDMKPYMNLIDKMKKYKISTDYINEILDVILKYDQKRRDGK